jgi:hypothetical protein
MVVDVIKRNIDGGWWYGMAASGAKGYFPGAFVKVCTAAALAIECATDCRSAALLAAASACVSAWARQQRARAAAVEGSFGAKLSSFGCSFLTHESLRPALRHVPHR